MKFPIFPKNFQKFYRIFLENLVQILNVKKYAFPGSWRMYDNFDEKLKKTSNSSKVFIKYARIALLIIEIFYSFADLSLEIFAQKFAVFSIFSIIVPLSNNFNA